MTFHQAFTNVEFTCQVIHDGPFGHHEPGEVLTVGLTRDWDEEEGLGEGGPWGWSGYTDELIQSLI